MSTKAIYTCILGMATAGLAYFAPQLNENIAHSASSGTKGRHIRTQSRTFRPKGNGEVHLQNIQGKIEVTTHQRPEIIVRVRQCMEGKAPLIPITVNFDGKRVTYALQNKTLGWLQSTGCGFFAAYKVSAPQGTLIHARSVSGKVSVTTTKAAVTARTVSGTIRIIGSARTSARSVSGNITLKGTKGDIHLKTVSGTLRLNNVIAQRITLKSVSAAIKASAVRVSQRLTGKTTSGQIIIHGLTPALANHFKTMSGAIRLQLKDNKGIRIRAKTFSGRIDSRYPLGSVHPHGHNGSTKSIRCKSFSGGIQIR